MEICIDKNARKTVVPGKCWQRMLDLLFGMFSVAVFLNGLLVMYHKHLARAEEHTMASWLVGYSPGGGYVRRGLSGEVLWWLNQWGISPEFVIFPLCLAVFVAVWAWFGATVAKRGLNWWILPTSFCLGGLFPLTRDYCILLLVMAMVRAHARIHHPVLRFVAVNLIGIVAIHLHEISFFVTVPFLFLLLWSETDGWREKIFRTLSLAPLVLSFGLVALFRGNPEICSKMATAWSGVLTSGYWDGVNFVAGLKGAIGSDAAFYARLTANNLFVQYTAGLPNAVWLVLFGFCIFLAASRALTLYRKGVDAESLPVLLVFQSLCLIPVFPFFIDYSRLFAYAILSTYWFWLEMGNQRCARAIPFRILPCRRDTRPRRLLLICLLVFTGMSTINLVVEECFARSVVGYLVNGTRRALQKSEECLPSIQGKARGHGHLSFVEMERASDKGLSDNSTISP